MIPTAGSSALAGGLRTPKSLEGRVGAMADLNKVFLMGRLTFDPELRRTPGGTAVAELRMATTQTFPGRDGERREETLFIDVTVWDRQAENCCQYLRKGSQIHVEGSLRMDTWEDKTSGEKRSKIRVRADRVQFLDTRRAEGGGPEDELASAPQARESGMRKSSASAAAKGAGGGSGEHRGPANGPSRAPVSPPAPSGGASIDDEPAEEDIPF
jgi:single-strand DNA-binding protein